MLTKNFFKNKNVWESKKYRVKRLIKEFPNKKWSKRGVEDFQKRLRTTGPLNEHPVVDVRARRALLRTLTLRGPGTQPGESTSTRQIPRELGIPQTNNWR